MSERIRVEEDENSPISDVKDDDKGVENPAFRDVPLTDDVKPSVNRVEERAESNGVALSEPKVIVEDDDDEKKKKKEKKEMVGAVEIFRYADKLGIFLMVVGGIAAAIHGAALPLMIIVFGAMVDSFVGSGNATQELQAMEAMCNPDMLTTFCNTLKPSDCPRLTNPIQVEVYNNMSATICGKLTGQMNTYAFYYIGLALGVFVIGYLQVICWLSAAYRQTRKIRCLFFQSLLRKEIGWFDTHEVRELNTRLADDVNKIHEGIGEKLSNFLQWFFTFVVGFIIAFTQGWKLTLVILAVSPLLAIVGGIMGKLGTSLTSKELKAYARAGAVAEEVFSSIRTVVAFGGEDKECERYTSNLYDARSYGIKKGVITGVAMGAFFFILFASYSLAFWYGSSLIRSHEYTPGKLLVVFFCVLIGAFALGNAAPNLDNFSGARGAAYAIFRIIDETSKIDSYSEEGMKPANLKGNISFRNVHFNYPSRPEIPILQGFNLNVDVGETAALVGASGCGKSTTVQLLQRFYDVDAGSITIDGYNIKDLNIRWLRQKIGVVSQEPVLFATTIGENIRYGREGVTDEEIEEACRKSNIHSFIASLPSGYDTLVGERGAQLSGGQKQRIAIARALVKDPAILLLDEATSALDTESEAVVQEALDKAREGRTTLVIAHRLSTVRTADQIAGVSDGVVVEKGSHDELMEKDGLYHQLVTNQQAHFQEDDHDEEEHEVLKMKRSLSIDKPAMKRGMSVSSESSFKRKLSTAEELLENEETTDVSMMRILRLNSPETVFILLGCIGALISGAIQPAFAVVFSEILGVFAIRDENKQEERANFYSLMFLVIGIIAAFGMLLKSVAFARSGEYLTFRLRQMIFRGYLRQDIGYYDDHRHNTGALTTRLATDASAVQGATGVRLGTICQSLCSIGVGVVIGFVFSWKLTLVILAFVPLLLVAGAIQMRIHTGQAAAGQAALEDAGKTSTEVLLNIRTVASLTKEPHFEAQYNRQLAIPHRQNMRKSHFVALAFSFSQAIIFFAYAACFTFGAHLVENEGLAFQNMFKVFAAIVFGALSIGQASAFVPDYGKAKSAAGRLFYLLDLKPEIDTFSEEGQKPGQCTGTMEFQDVYFKYPSRPNIPVLQGLNVKVTPGEQLALVGSSGCGKSTTVQLMERFYQPESGEVMLDNVDIKDINVKWLRSKLGLVSQEPVLFGYSIKENIAYGDNSRQVEMDEIIAASRSANIHNFIDSLPNGYDTNVGDMGTQLSGGQKQRVAIARALVRNPKVLLLDEATSALDTESEQIVQEALDKAQEGRTSIVIAHRLSTIQNADCIAVIHKGRVVESGTHSELLSLKGRYYKLNNAQLTHN